MNLKFAIDKTAEEWADDEHIVDCGSYSELKSGFWYTALKLPLSANLHTCHANHGIYASFKYRALFENQDWKNSLGLSLPELSNGILHTGSAPHYHFLIDGIGNLSAAALRAAQNLFVDADYSDDQLTFLSRVIYAQIGRQLNLVRVPPGTYRATNVIIMKTKNLPHRVRKVRTLVGQLRVEQDKPKQRIYVTRRRANTRHLFNEAQFIDKICANYKFKVVENEDLTLQEQLELYSNAEFVIGPHGAGLTNVVFSKRPRGLLEFWHSVKQPFYGHLCQVLEISYLNASGIPLPSTSAGWRKDNNSFIVDENMALRAVELLVARTPAG